MEPVPDAELADAWDSEWIKELNEAWRAYHPGEELPDDATPLDRSS